MFFNSREKAENTTSKVLLLSFFLQCLKDSKQNGRVKLLKEITYRNRFYYRYMEILLITQTAMGT